MILLGITGGIGTGKSTCADLLRTRGVAVVDTDQVAREVVAPGEPALDELSAAFGTGILRSDGSLDREAMGRLAFGDAAVRRRLEEILHPRIRQRWGALVEKWRSEGRELGAVVIPLLFETQAQDRFDAVICLACSRKSQVQRLEARGWTHEHMNARLAAQWPLEKKMERARFVLWTEGPVAIHAAQLDLILETARQGRKQVNDQRSTSQALGAGIRR